VTATRIEADLGQAPIDTSPSEGDLTMWSVTTIIGCLDKPALLYWSAEQAAKSAVSSAGSLTARVDEEGEEAVVKWLRDARFRKSKDTLSATALGTICHTACEEYALSGARPSADRLTGLVRAAAPRGFTGTVSEVATLTRMLDRFDEWLQRFTPTYQATEVACYNPTYGYAGTTDGFLSVDGQRFIIDYKSSREATDSRGIPKSPYPEVSLQLAAYRWAEFAAVWRPRRTEKFRRRYYLLSPGERELAVGVPEVDGGLCIHLTPEACEAYPVRCDEPVHTAFLYVLEAARWSFDLSRHVIGDPLEAA
jgi:hypothetical protein